MKSILKAFTMAMCFLTCLDAAGQDDVADIPSKKLQAGGDLRSCRIRGISSSLSSPVATDQRLSIHLSNGSTSTGYLRDISSFSLLRSNGRQNNRLCGLIRKTKCRK